MTERTLLLIKPDAIELGITEELVERFCNDGFKIIRRKVFFPTPELIEWHYEKKFSECPSIRKSVIVYLTLGTVVALLVEREDAIQLARNLIGDLRNPPPGTIRGDFKSDSLHSLMHGSDSPEAAIHEIEVWFGDSTKTKMAEEGDEPMDTSCTRRALCTSLLFLGTASLMPFSFSSSVNALLLDRKESFAGVRNSFACAIAEQRNGNKKEALKFARKCLHLVESFKTAEETAAGSRLFARGHTIYEPSFLHIDTVKQRFRIEGIQV